MNREQMDTITAEVNHWNDLMDDPSWDENTTAMWAMAEYIVKLRTELTTEQTLVMLGHVELNRLLTMMEYDANAFAWLLNYVVVLLNDESINPEVVNQYVREIRAGKRDRDGRRICTTEDNALVEDMAKRATPVNVSRFDPWVKEQFEEEPK